MSRILITIISLGIVLCSFAKNPFSYGLDSTIYFSLVYPRDWKALPEGFYYHEIDTTLGKQQINACLMYNGKRVAIGSLKRNKPHGWWGIFHKDRPEKIIISGHFKHGRKERIWVEIECWHIIYGRRFVKKITHSVFHC